MKKFGQTALACAALVGAGLAPQAHAGMVTFDDIAPDFYFGGFAPFDSFESGGFRFTLNEELGIVDGAASYAPFNNAPTGNDTQFLGVFNDGSVTMARADGSSFKLVGLDYGFVSIFGGAYAPGDDPGALVVQATPSAGGAPIVTGWSWGPADGFGEFAFQSLGFAGLGSIAGVSVDSVTFRACTFEAGACVTGPFFNLNQFAIDNIEVPEPGSLALAALGLGIAGFSRRRTTR